MKVCHPAKPDTFVDARNIPLMVPDCSLYSLDNVGHRHNAKGHMSHDSTATHCVYMVCIMVT